MTRYEYYVTFKVDIYADDEETATELVKDLYIPEGELKDYDLNDWEEIPREECMSDERGMEDERA